MQIAFPDLSKYNVTNCVSSSIPFTSNKLLHQGKALSVLMLLLLHFLWVFFKACMMHFQKIGGELSGCAECFLNSAMLFSLNTLRYRWSQGVSIKSRTGGPCKHRQALQDVAQFSKQDFFRQGLNNYYLIIINHFMAVVFQCNIFPVVQIYILMTDER